MQAWRKHQNTLLGFPTVHKRSCNKRAPCASGGLVQKARRLQRAWVKLDWRRTMCATKLVNATTAMGQCIRFDHHVYNNMVRMHDTFEIFDGWRLSSCTTVWNPTAFVLVQVSAVKRLQSLSYHEGGALWVLSSWESHVSSSSCFGDFLASGSHCSIPPKNSMNSFLSSPAKFSSMSESDEAWGNSIPAFKLPVNPR